ncbi:MAG: GntR family transcriptional regulator [Thermoplasmatales archaeon]|nr:GntR family transcriptional regulator [Thermoplasmatales archaeon]MCW6169797.1 GntR family transcriptional regulator [Thermoplasmatales archaeon]
MEDILIKIEFDSEMPIYLQIYWQIVKLISKGTLKQGSKLPSSRKLAIDLSVNYHTVNRAYDMLVERDFAHRNERKQTIIGQDKKNNDKFISEWLKDEKLLISEAKATGFSSKSIIRLIERILDQDM